MWCVLMVAMGFTHYTLMIVLRILLGVAEGPLFPLAFAIVRHNFPQHLQARATMLWLLGTPVGAAIGFPLSLWLLNTFGWQSTFFVMAMLTVPVLIFVRIGLRGIRGGKTRYLAGITGRAAPHASCLSARTSGSSASLTSLS